MSQMHFVLFVAAVFALVGCSTTRANRLPDPATRAQTELVGMSKKDLLLCAGVPVRQTRVEDIELLVFRTESFFDGTHTYCQATVALKNDAVEKITYEYRYATPFRRLRECGLIVQRCLDPQK